MPYPICHAFVALQYNKNPKHTLGSIFPDVTHLLVKDKKHLFMKKFIHEINAKKYDKDFIDGIKVHIALDHYFHEQYLYKKRDILINEFSMHPSTAEGYIEIELDRLVDKKYPEVAKLIKKSMKSINTKQFAIYLSDSIDQPLKKVKKALRDARLVTSFKKPYKLRNLVIKALILRKYSRLRVRDFRLFKSRKIIKRAEQLIKDDYQKELKKAIKIVKTLRKHPFKEE